MCVLTLISCCVVFNWSPLPKQLYLPNCPLPNMGGRCPCYIVLHTGLLLKNIQLFKEGTVFNEIIKQLLGETDFNFKTDLFYN